MAAAHCPGCDKPYADRTGRDPCPRCGWTPVPSQGSLAPMIVAGVVLVCALAFVAGRLSNPAPPVTSPTPPAPSPSPVATPPSIVAVASPQAPVATPSPPARPARAAVPTPAPMPSPSPTPTPKENDPWPFNDDAKVTAEAREALKRARKIATPRELESAKNVVRNGWKLNALVAERAFALDRENGEVIFRETVSSLSFERFWRAYTQLTPEKFDANESLGPALDLMVQHASAMVRARSR